MLLGLDEESVSRYWFEGRKEKVSVSISSRILKRREFIFKKNNLTEEKIDRRIKGNIMILISDENHA